MWFCVFIEFRILVNIGLGRLFSVFVKLLVFIFLSVLIILVGSIFVMILFWILLDSFFKMLLWKLLLMSFYNLLWVLLGLDLRMWVMFEGGNLSRSLCIDMNWLLVNVVLSVCNWVCMYLEISVFVIRCYFYKLKDE